ncbi:DUF2634 domain-containing protein [Exiguobacterium aestuarii]|uniref:DUF2634 domain-containing protein n=1 Tax=Exiguobacterium aestuarii TaxID=273527 RepID=UPI001CD208AF|nr:DUF2634 domain-containing protein [Exiguobacterium aestuarii]MCA0980246.1 DUF2634 domain-containing protein [Exiguobacterium aestuarii]
MKDLKLKDGDLVIWENDVSLVDGKEEVAQSLLNAVGTNIGEFQLEPDMGIEFFNILGKGVTKEDIQAEVFAGLSQEERVETVDEISVSIDSLERKTSIDFTVTTVEGDIIESEVDYSA